MAALTSCSNDTAGTEAGVDVEDIQEDAADEPLEDGLVFEDVAEDVASYVGATVTVSADVNEVLTPAAFTIAGTENTSIEALLVVGAGPFDPAVEVDTAVSVSGVVRQSLVLSELEEEFGLDAPDDVFVDWEQEPYIVATEVTPVVVDE